MKKLFKTDLIMLSVPEKLMIIISALFLSLTMFTIGIVLFSSSDNLYWVSGGVLMFVSVGYFVSIVAAVLGFGLYHYQAKRERSLIYKEGYDQGRFDEAIENNESSSDVTNEAYRHVYRDSRI